MSAVEDLIQELKDGADYRWFGTRVPETQSAIRHGYLLALEELASKLEVREVRDGR